MPHPCVCGHRTGFPHHRVVVVIPGMFRVPGWCTEQLKKKVAQQFDPANQDRMPHITFETPDVLVMNVAIQAALFF